MEKINAMLETWAERRFEGLSRQELRDCGKALGADFAPNTSEATMRAKLNEIIGQNDGKLPSVTGEATNQPSPTPEQPTAKVINLPRLTRPKLRATDVWEGRRHDVKVFKGESDAMHQCFVLTWDGHPRNFPFDEVVHMPEPYFNILKTATNRLVRQRPVKDSDGNLLSMESYVVASPKFSYHYMGLTPGTEELPGSILEYWQERAKRNNYLQDVPGKPGGRQALIQILSDLTEPKGPEYYKDMTDQDILVQIIRFLGFEDLLYSNIESALIK